MSTRCLIGRQVGKDIYRMVFCHYDGYLDGVGKTLLENYQDQSTLDELLEMGDMESLDNTIYRCHFYGRDNGWEPHACASRFMTLKNLKHQGISIEYIYWMGLDGKWRYIDCWNDKSIRLLLTRRKSRAKEPTE